MRTTVALSFKFVVTLFASWISFTLIDVNPIEMIFLVAFSGTILNYVLGDLLTLPSMGNVIASIGDGILAAATAYLFDIFSYSFVTTSTSLIVFASVIGVCEYFFHIYLMKDDKVMPNEYHREPPVE